MQNISKPVIITGLFYLLFFFHNGIASSVTEMLYQYLFPTYNTTHFVSDSTFINIKTHYNNILTIEGQYPSKDSSISIDVASHQISTMASLSKNDFGVNILIKNHGLNIEMHRRYTERSNKTLNSQSLISELSITPWIKKENFSLGIEIGKTFSPEFYKDPTDLEIQQPITELTKNREVILGAFANVNYKFLDFSVSDSTSNYCPISNI